MNNKKSETTSRGGEQDILDHLEAYVDANADDDPLARETAVTYLMEQDVGRVEVSDRIKQLLLKGYLYEVGKEIRIPPRPDDLIASRMLWKPPLRSDHYEEECECSDPPEPCWKSKHY